MPADTVPAVEVRDLTVRYGPSGATVAVDGLTLEARAGEVLVVLGPNGAGKTSTIESLEGYRRPAGGRITVLGLDPIADHARLTGRMGVMLQNGGVYPMLGPRRVLDLFSAYYPDPLATEALLDLVALRAVAATPWRHLSGGEQQRLSLALALIGRPQVVFLDEPTAGRRSRGPPRHQGGRGRPPGPGGLRASDHPRTGGGREDGRPHRDPLPGPDRPRRRSASS